MENSDLFLENEEAAIYAAERANAARGAEDFEAENFGEVGGMRLGSLAFAL